MAAPRQSGKIGPKGQELQRRLPAWAAWSIDEPEHLYGAMFPHGWRRPARLDWSLRKPAPGATPVGVIDHEDEINLRCGEFVRMAALPEAVDANKAKAKTKTKDYTLELILVDMASR